MPFLRSVDTIEVHRISHHGVLSPIFKVEIEQSCKGELKSKRQCLIEQLRTAHSRQSYGISNPIDFIADFHVKVTDCCTVNQSGSTHFLVAATVGSSTPSICEAAKKQKVFPWVGTALQLDTTLSNNGRIFCFLPMPVDAASKLPVHVNGTFGLNDDRRSMKWPGLERRNDPTANWNELLVSQLLPPCYAKLLIHAKALMPSTKFYEAWPEVKVIKGTHWEKILCPLFKNLFAYPVFWSERTEALRKIGEWVTHSSAVFTPPMEELPSVLHKALSNSGLKLVTVSTRAWNGLRTASKGVTEISPRLARQQFRSQVHSYVNIDPVGKSILLKYCLKDQQYNDLQGIYLLPLANGNFVHFQQGSIYTSRVYLCNSTCPHYLLPNLDHILVNIENDQSLLDNLRCVANSNCTQLTLLTVNDVAQLLPQSMPSSWHSGFTSVVSMANSNLPSSWFELFWKWVRNHNLNQFRDLFVLPVGTNDVVRLKLNQAVVFISQYSSYSDQLLSAFNKLGVRYCLQSRFPYVEHQSLSNYVNQYNANGILDSIHVASQYSSAVFTKDEARALTSRLAQDTLYNMTSQRISVIKGLAMFSLTPNSSLDLCSPNKAATYSLRRAIIEPLNLRALVKQLPNNFLLFSRNNHSEVKLLQSVSVESPNDANFLFKFIFPLIPSMPDRYVDPVMQEVLHAGASLATYDQAFKSSLTRLAFIRTASGYRKAPNSLFDPSNTALAELYKGESVFPTEPYNSYQWLSFLKQWCGLRTSVTPDEILSIISAIKQPARGYPQAVNLTYLSRAKAVLRYISAINFQRQATGSCFLRELRGYMPFSTALNYYASNYSWLPVLHRRPSDYPAALPWKGEGFTSHFFALNSQGSITTNNNVGSLPYIIGSQRFMTDPADTPSCQLTVSDSSFCAHVIAQLRLLISNHQSIPMNNISIIVNQIYSYLSGQNVINLKQLLQSNEKWIYIRKHNVFVSPSVVAVNPNPSFRHDLEPYVYTLPETLLKHQTFFTQLGVASYTTQSQIITVLRMIKDEGSTTLSSSTIWSIVMAILNWLTDNGTKSVSISAGDQIYVPTESDSEWPQLMVANDVVYTDNDFLKNFLGSLSCDESYTFVHGRISARLANCLRLTPLSDFLDITEDTFEDTGQHEPLTVRLKNILRDYKDGLTIAKELLQNADDAEATEVNFCFDGRTHSVDSNSLFFPEMLQAHGPALLVHNNRKFSKEDFDNITKLAAATKKDQQLKIGKFGIGFCSVYHITDVPSFVSGDTLTIFDPTMNYLKKEIKNPNRPGKKVKYTSRLIQRSNQLAPYVGLFNFDPQKEYDCTLFRFPFRSAASELSGTCYTEDHHIKQLISEMTACSSSLILFLQHVQKITFQVIKTGESNATICLEISKDALSMPCLSPTTSLQKITLNTPPQSQTFSYWVVSNNSLSINGKYATASVACSLLSVSSNLYSVQTSLDGEVFCYLPLAQKTGLPVHVSGNFAVINNRQGIWTSDATTYLLNDEVRWNLSLMNNNISAAYHQLLIDIQSMQNSLQDYQFYSLWPLEESLKLKNPWTTLIRNVCNRISTSKLFYSVYTSQWLSLNESKFLDPNILCQSSSSANNNVECIAEVVNYLKLPVVHLPSKYCAHFNLKPHIISENEFLSLFFQNLGRLTSIQKSRDQLILCMLEVYAAEYDNDTTRSYVFQDYFHKYACIPCAPDGRVLRHCNELIDPEAPFAKLYDEDENRFPAEELAMRQLANISLNELGMRSETIPYENIVDRAQTIPNLFIQDHQKALNRVKLILKTISLHMDNSTGTHSDTLDSVSFLPVIPKPSNYPLSWAGDGHHLRCGKDLMVHSITRKHSNENNSVIAGSQVIFVNESTNSEGGCGIITSKVQDILKIRARPSCSEVILHLKGLIKTCEAQAISDDLKKFADRTCQQIYKYLDERQSEQEIKCIQELAKIPCIWTGEKFLHIHVVAKKWNHNGPYLHQVPSVLSLRRNLCKVVQVKDDFTKEDIETALKQMKQDFGENPVDEASQHILKALVSYLLEIKPDEFSNFKILLPDVQYVLRWSTDLAYNDAPWAPKDEVYKYVNDIIPRALAKQLHVKPVRTKLSEKYANPISSFRGVAFGQREELTRRIQNILREYPFDITVLKELLQNADDAKACKMCVILDKRTHGGESLLSEKWQKLQGPALLVWNNTTFSERDIKGIQELGLGSKRSEAESIGQYGIGFNSVYHLTDCPSFVTNGDTLCVMDPHCEFVPGATPLSPGRRFDNIKSGFWSDFPDVKSAFLQSNVDNLPVEFHGGSLFRFPLRSTPELVKSSQIAADLPGDTVVTGIKMQNLIDIWAPRMKAAMFFLNNVRELQFYVIERGSKTLKTQYHYCIDVSLSAQQSCERLRSCISAFKSVTGSEPCVVRYPLTIIDVDHSGDKEKKHREKWIIQQGVGDIQERNRVWTFVRNIKPRHGIAAPVDIVKGAHSSQPASAIARKFRGQVFCFLPLPISSGLPVHINGHFILNSTRRELWQSTNPGEEDSRTIWNKTLLDALSSSYADFLKNAHVFFVSQKYSKWSVLRDDLDSYYSIFPEASAAKLDKKWLDFAKNCYKKICKSNAKILAVVKQPDSNPKGQQTSSPLIVRWDSIRSETPSYQAYFWLETVELKKSVQPVLEAIGMQITVAPLRLRRYLNDAIDNEQCECPEITPSSVYAYYIHYFNQSGDITMTSFVSVERFKVLINYILQKSELGTFPSSPIGYPLLLTADKILRRFDDKNRVLFSKFVSLFPKSHSLFVHPDLLDIKLSSSYFAAGDSCYVLIHRILTENLPTCLCDVQNVCNASAILSIQKLQRLWQCFVHDHAFSCNLKRILSRWALILTNDNRTFSNSCNLHPLIPPSNEEQCYNDIFQVIMKMGMPIVETSVVITTTATSSPSISEHSQVLTSLYYLSQELELSQKLSSTDVDKLVEYLKCINFHSQLTSCKQVKALPLFEDVVGKFTPVTGITAFIWPTSYTCKTGYEKWIKGSRSSVIFLRSNGSWSQLATPKNLGILHIEAEDMFVTYIFPYFHLMSESERYEHLQYIRDNMFDGNKYNAEHRVAADLRRRALTFISELKKLQCIGSDGHPLRKISDFCDHEKEIFTTFSCHFQFLPDYFTNRSSETPQWMAFFRELGLRTTVSHEEFIIFCMETSTGRTADVQKASSVLIDFLFSVDEGWYSDQAFLSKVSSISFLCAEKLPSLTWILPAAQTSNCIVQNNKEFIMTEPRKAALIQHAIVLWTVTPIVVLPDKESILHDMLSVCSKPSNADVIENLCNICQLSKYNNTGLFDNFPNELKQPANVELSLSQIVLGHFLVLKDSLSEQNISVLKQLSCIPVPPSRDPLLCPNTVLVRPQSVVACKVLEYHPFLQELPVAFECVMQVMEKIDVRRQLDLKHMQIMLDSARKCTEGGEMDMNTAECVLHAVKFIYKKLKTMHDDESQNEENRHLLTICGDQLSPLYLPSKNGSLVLSTNLLYHDKSYFRSKHLDFGSTTYSELHMPYSQYSIYDVDFCELLPPTVRPKRMSDLCTVKLANDCVKCEHSALANNLLISMKLSMLPKALTIAVNHKFPKDKKISQELLPSMTTMLNSIDVITYNTLKLEIFLKQTETVIGKRKVLFFLDINPKGHKMHLDATLKGLMASHMYSELAELVMVEIQQICKSNLPHSLKHAIECFLKADSAPELLQELERRRLPITDIAAEEKVTLGLGMEIPQQWHHRLDQDVDNVFHANEYVGYEDDDGHFIVVKIVHAITTGGIEDLMSRYTRKYLVLTKDEDEGTEVSVLALYKFVKGGKREKKSRESHALVLYEGKARASESDSSDTSLKIAKERLCEELKEIWRLNPEDRKRAIKRLYLKWHPDRNPDNPIFAENVFKFMQAQIEHLEKGESLDDPEGQQRPSSSTGDAGWGRFYREWDDTAQQHQTSHQNESRSRNRSRGSGRGYHGVPFSAGDENFRVPRQPDEGRRWFRQATIDCKVLKLLCDQMTIFGDDEIAGHVCFMAHQVAEKALKAGMYAVCGLDDSGLKDHVLTRHAYALQTENPHHTALLASYTAPLETYYLDTRYPNRHLPPTIPADTFSPARALQAKENAENIYSIIELLLGCS